MHQTTPLRRRIGSAHLLAGVALFVALGGTAMANDSVRALITGADVRNGSLTGRDVRNRSLTSADLAPDVLRTGPAGAQGPAGPRGPAGERGPAGPDLAGATHVRVRGDASSAENGEALRAALASITDASASKPYVIQLAPGIYDLGNRTLAMKADVSIAGAGATTTRIVGDLGEQALGEALVLGAHRTDLRDVTIAHRGNARLPETLAVEDATMRIEDVVLQANPNYGGIALVVVRSSVEVRDSRIESDSVEGRAAAVRAGSHVRIRGSDVVARGATALGLTVSDAGTSAVVENSTLEGTGRAVQVLETQAWVAASRVVGGSREQSGAVTCVGSYNASFQAVNSHCN